jgi:hypothetical protein
LLGRRGAKPSVLLIGWRLCCVCAADVFIALPTSDYALIAPAISQTRIN